MLFRTILTRGLLAGAAIGFTWAPAIASSSQWNGNGHAYEAVLVPAGINWADANAGAQLAGGQLATITSAAENAFVFNLVDDASYWFVAGDNSRGPWLGGLQAPGSSEPADGWSWVTAEPFAPYTNWAPGEPNDGGGFGPEDRLHFISQNPGLSTAPTWNDLAGTSTVRGYVIEYVPEPTGAGLMTAALVATLARRGRRQR